MIEDLKSNFHQYKEYGVLYVEDEPGIQQITAQILQLIFGEVFLQSNGKDGLEFYEQNKEKIDVVITDINMPIMNGLDMSVRMKDIDPDLLIIITSAHNENDFLLKAINIGINGFLLKPVDPVKFIKTISKTLEPKVLQHKLKVQEEQNQERLLKNTKFLAIGQLSAGLTHEINTPLTYIKGSAEIMKYLFEDMDSSSLKDSLIKQHVRIEDGVNRLINIVESMKEMSKTSSHNVELSNIYETAIVACTMAYNRAKHIVNIKINDNNFSMDMDKQQEQFNAYVQKQRVEQVWIIIINNALDELIKIKDFSQRILHINIDQDEKYVTIKFIDNAGGIPDNIFDELFEPFKSTKESSGVGVGLSIARKIIEDQNATIEAYNENNGAVFEVKLPKFESA